MRKKQKVIIAVGARAALSVVELIAQKNARSLCKGLLYEPEVPKKLRDVDNDAQYC